MEHKAGFVSIIGRPNVGKSTLMNGFLGEKISIVTSKSQTTRHRIFGIYNTDNVQIVFSDTPGLIHNPSYKLHEAMNSFVYQTNEDSDILIFLTDIFDDLSEDENESFFKTLNSFEGNKYLVINKTDLNKEDKLDMVKHFWNSKVNFSEIFEISALNQINTQNLLTTLIDKMPVHPPFYPKDQLTDKTERFIVSEIIREKVFTNYSKEIPYSVEIEIEFYKEEESINKIGAIIYVERNSQKGIIIGKNGDQLKKIGTEARKDMEKFLDKKVYLELHVKVKENWRGSDFYLKKFGYKE